MLPGQDLLEPEFLKRLEYLDFIAKKIASGEGRGERSSSAPGRAVEFRDHRTYAPGDDVRYIDWNVYLRLDELVLKEFESEEHLNVAIVVDRSESMNFGANNKLEYARRMAAALGYVGLSHFDSVAVMPHPPGPALRAAPLSGKSQRREWLRRLSELGPLGGGSIADTIRALPAIARGSLLIMVISDFYDEEGFERACDQVRARRARGLGIHLVDPLEIRPGIRGSVRLRDAETGREQAMEVDEAFLERYRREIDLHLDRVERFCRNKEFGFARIETSVPFDTSVLSILRQGRILR
ncbi:MAG: DUF58 domain-containing protein [Planctomycetes bacterium]|nr:DUF58 domain-containing protein [Planctomycetota bacterium]